MLEPTPTHQRLDYLDLLRGIAILGILLINIRSFAFPLAEFLTPGTVTTLSGLDNVLLTLVRVLAEWKFLTLLTVLFGAGIWLFAQRLDQREQNPRPLHFRRCRWLLWFGLVHGFLLWHGDILAIYALSAMLVWPMRKYSVRRQIVLALGFLLFCYFVYVSLGAFIASLSPEELNDEFYFWTEAGAKEEMAMFRSGGLEPFEYRLREYGNGLIGLFATIWREVGLMLLGMVIARRGSAWLAARPKVLPALTAIGLILGLALSTLAVVVQMQTAESFMYSKGTAYLTTYWASVLMALGYAGLAYYWAGSRLAAGLKRRLQAAGRMALSLYFMQTLICVGLFYSYGLGLFGRLSHSQTFLLVVVIWIFQLWFASWWLNRFRFGPAEYLWRRLTYRSQKGRA